jgi:large subunit ribosomal protein L17
MRHQKAGKRLGRTTSHRKAMMRNMATSLLDHERIETTETKAKELRRYAEKMITLGKRGDLHARRQALSFIRKREVVAKVFDVYAERFKDRDGGYTRVMKLGKRIGDGARMAIIELIPDDQPKKKKGKKDKSKKKVEALKGSKEVKTTKAKKDVKGDKEKEKDKKAIKKETIEKKVADKKAADKIDKPKKEKIKKGSAEKEDKKE